MTFSSRKVDDVIVFDYKGALEKGFRKILLNMDKVALVNSTGIGIVTATFVAITNAGGRMKISSANEKVSRVLMVTKLLDVFDSYYAETEALRAFEKA